MTNKILVHKRVIFKETEYWLHDDLLSPIHHYSEDGELLADPLCDISYAIIEEDRIMRYGEKIGNISELKEV